MQGRRARSQLRFIASLGLSPQDSIPAAVAVVEAAIPCMFAVLFLLGPGGQVRDAYLANPIPEAMEAFIGGQAGLRALPGEPTLDKVLAAGLVVDALAPFRGAGLRDTQVYRTVLSRFGIGMGLDLTLRAPGGRPLAILILNRPFEEDRWTRADIALLADFHDNLARILAVPEAPPCGPWSEPPDRTGYLVADGEGRVQFAAGEANLLVAQYCGLRFEEGLAYRDLLARLPRQLRELARGAAGGGEVRCETTSPWGQVSLRVLGELPVPGQAGGERFQYVLERRLSRASVVLGEVTAAPLSTRERELAWLMGLGLASDRIAAEMRITPATIKAYAKSVYGKLGVDGRAELAARLRRSPA